ncbi:MAG: thiolase family protein [Syntrophobacteraceae bacterium]|nr:thiolase family protein [Syntrophobacteraceae bacterium]
MFQKAFIPYKGYYCTPFCRWQGAFANENSLVLGAETAKRWFATKSYDMSEFDYTFFGITVGQHHWFYGGTWVNSMIGLQIPAINIMQACSTGTTCVYNAALAIEHDQMKSPICLTTDRLSNGPHTIWPNPNGPGGEVISENWAMDNFNSDPVTGLPMIQTAENAAKKAGLTREQADELALRRYEQYLDSMKDDRAFQKRYMFPVEVKISKKKTVVVDADEGIMPTTREGLASLRPVLPGGIHTFGAQTHPADGNAVILVTTRERAAAMSGNSAPVIQVISYGFARVEKAHMPMAPVPAARMALERAGLSIKDVSVIKTHNPFAANDLYFCKEFGVDFNSFNNYGSSLVFGHPQAPTVPRLIIEGIEEAVMKGGGYVLITGCAAGDTGAALVLKVN